VRWKFLPRTKIIAEKNPDTNLEELELELIDKGATDFQTDDDQLMVLAEPTARDAIEGLLDVKGLEIIESEIEHHVPDEQRIKLTPEQTTQFNKLIDELENHSDVRAVHTDIAS
jgi:transcriptional/translational regulatory protein YebC/TACO1